MKLEPSPMVRVKWDDREQPACPMTGGGVPHDARTLSVLADREPSRGAVLRCSNAGQVGFAAVVVTIAAFPLVALDLVDTVVGVLHITVLVVDQAVSSPQVNDRSRATVGAWRPS